MYIFIVDLSSNSCYGANLRHIHLYKHCLNAVVDGASKHAVQCFFDALRAEVATHGIHVSVISPAYIKTNLSLNALTTDGSTYGSE